VGLDAEELGRVARERRIALGRTQVAVVAKACELMGADVVSEPTLRAVETGRTAATDRVLAAISRGLDWPPNALASIRDGADVSTFEPDDEPMTMDASGVDLEELRQLDPDAYEQLVQLGRTLLERARERDR